MPYVPSVSSVAVRSRRAVGVARVVAGGVVGVGGRRRCPRRSVVVEVDVAVGVAARRVAALLHRLADAVGQRALRARWPVRRRRSPACAPSWGRAHGPVDGGDPPSAPGHRGWRGGLRALRTRERRPGPGSVAADGPPPSRRSCSPAATCRRRGCRCGSCARPAARCPSTAPSAARGSILDAIRDPDLATEITLQPVRRYGVDAAILYSDIVVPGGRHRVRRRHRAPGSGRWSSEPFRDERDLDRLRPLDPEADCPYVQQTVRQLVGELGDVPLIGFAGAPFTVASYLVEGGPSRTLGRTKALMLGRPDLWDGAARPPGRHRHRLAAGPGAGRGPGDPAVRLLGGHPEPRRCTSATCCPPAPGCSPAWPTSACPASTSA